MNFSQPIKASQLTSVTCIKHGFFTRQDGVSDGLYKGRNCGLGSDDDTGKVRQNLKLCADQLGLDAPNPLCLKQVHGTDILIVDNTTDLAARPEADGMVTNRPGIGLAIATADCIPILAVDPDTQIIGAAHAGWRGAFDGIAQNLIATMVHSGARRENIIAAIGPSLSQAHFEVGPEFVDRFTDANTHWAHYFKPLGAKKTPHFDNAAFVKDRLIGAGLIASNVQQTNICTYAHANAFFSFRRTTHLKQPDYGRQISIIALDACQIGHNSHQVG